MITGFEVVVHRGGAAAIVEVHGELDLATAPCLRAELAGLAEEGTLEVTVDLAQLDFIDSTGLHVLVSALKRFRAGGGDLALRGASAKAMKILELTGLVSVFRFAEHDERAGRGRSEGATA